MYTHSALSTSPPARSRSSIFVSSLNWSSPPLPLLRQGLRPPQLRRFRVVSCKLRREIHLDDLNPGDLFIACLVIPDKRETSVESVLDSSSYFVLKIDDGGRCLTKCLNRCDG